MNEALFNDFIRAQDVVYTQVIHELTKGHKRSHWMWFIFPQIKGLGRSTMAQRYAIQSLEQSQAYLQHDILGTRLVQCAELLLMHPNKSALDIFGSTDTLKLHSSLTLFALATNKDDVFEKLLHQFFDGDHDSNTIEMLKE